MDGIYITSCFKSKIHVHAKVVIHYQLNVVYIGIYYHRQNKSQQEILSLDKICKEISTL